MIKSEEITKLSELARIELQAKEKEAIKKDLGQILEYISKLRQANVQGVGELTHALEAMNEMRQDSEAEPPALRSALLTKAFKSAKNGFLKVKYIFY